MAADMRLQKYLARAGVASRRASEALILDGRVRVDGEVGLFSTVWMSLIVQFLDMMFLLLVGADPDGTWPVTRAQALVRLEEFVAAGLTPFGRHEDAMLAGEWKLAHSVLSSSTSRMSGR